MYTLKGLLENSNQDQKEINGEWVPARPHKWNDTLFDRVCDAWAVLKGDADAFTWPGGQ